MQPHPHIRFDKTYAQSGSMVAGSFPDLAALKTHLRIDYSSEDTYLNTILETTQSYIEEYCDVVFGDCDWTAYWDYAYPVVFVNKNFEVLKTTGANAPVLYELQSNGTYSAVDSDDYSIDYINSPLRVHMKSGFGSSANELNKYKLEFTTQTKSVPKYVYQAFLMIAGHFYENRQDVGRERVYEVPLTSKHLLERYRTKAFT